MRKIKHKSRATILFICLFIYLFIYLFIFLVYRVLNGSAFSDYQPVFLRSRSFIASIIPVIQNHLYIFLILCTLEDYCQPFSERARMSYIIDLCPFLFNDWISKFVSHRCSCGTFPEIHFCYQ